MSSGKIIIRPRKIQDNSTAATPSRLEVRNSSTPAEDGDVPTNDDDNDHDGGHDDDVDDEDAQTITTNNAATPPVHDGYDAAAAAAATPSSAGATPDDLAVEETALPMPRPRGRPRGRGRGALVGSERAGRARGARGTRGRGRGRGSRGGAGAGAGGTGTGIGGITIRLPGRGATGTSAGGAGAGAGAGIGTDAAGAGAGAGEDESVGAAVADGGGEDGTPGAEGSGAAAQDEEIMGGGKPFRVIQGKVYVIEGDELVTEDDPKGDTKIDKNGNLLGGRRFKAQTFHLPNRHPDRMFMLAIDAARTSGFRDSLYYFRRNPLAHKLNATQIEKEFLIEIGKLGSHLRTRSVTLITARSAFKLHGSKTLIDGRWVVDDYYEDKVLADITEKGLKPGDLVGELADPNAPSAAALAAAELANAQKADRAGGTQGIYRAGGPTTLFGGPGWGPYSDGPLNAVRKSLLNRDGLNEENWMLIAAQRTAEASAEWAKQRRRALVPFGGIFGAAAAAAVAGSTAAGKDEEEEDRGGLGLGLGEEDPGKAKGKGKGHGHGLTQGQQEQDGQGQGQGQEHHQGQDRRDHDDAGTRRRKRARREDKVPRGVYEPHSGIVLYRANTQPTRARWESLKDSEEKRQVLGGTKAGNGAWALAWVDTIMEVPASEEDDAIGRAAAEERQRLLQLAANDLNSS